MFRELDMFHKLSKDWELFIRIWLKSIKIDKCCIFPQTNKITFIIIVIVIVANQKGSFIYAYFYWCQYHFYNMGRKD